MNMTFESVACGALRTQCIDLEEKCGELRQFDEEPCSWFRALAL